MRRLVIIGGGIMGLSLAYDLTNGDDHAAPDTVTLLERGELGRGASWSGAGILTPPATTPGDPVAALRALSHRLLAEWSDRLRADTGIDNGYRRCGSWHLADPFAPGGDEALAAEAARWRREGIDHQRCATAEVAPDEPQLAGGLGPIYRVDSEAQLRNPWHLRALTVALARRGVELRTGTPAVGFDVAGGRLAAVLTPEGPIAADEVVLAAGSWSPELARRIGIDLPGAPVRGQIALLETDVPLLSRIVWAGSRYLVPRPDGLLLAGSTEERAGFDTRPTAGAMADLLALAARLVPATRGARFVRAWAGLRPGSPDTLPVLGRAPGWENLWLASGLFRSGFELSAGVARTLREAIAGRRPEVDLGSLGAARFAASRSRDTA